MELAACDAEQNRDVTKPVSAKDSKRRMVMRLHIVRGTFCTPPGRQCAVMDPALWSRLPEDIIWRVLRFVPAAKQFQLQLVSPKWRQMLTSAHFRNTIGSRAAPEESERQGVVACVTAASGNSSTIASRPRSRSRSSSKLKVVDIDLSFVPDSFWKSDTYDVVAAADGLVVISNVPERRWGDNKPKRNRYCVLNPLTRTCKLLPEFPFRRAEWLPPTTTTLTIHGFHRLRHGEAKLWEMATYDLAAAAGGSGGWVFRTYMPGRPNPQVPDPPAVAVCAGGTVFYHCWNENENENEKVKLLAADPDPAVGGTLVDVAAALDFPSVESLGLDSASHRFMMHNDAVCLVAHRGAVFLIAYLISYSNSGVDMCGLWRLARDRMEWEVVARLDDHVVQRLTGMRSLGTASRCSSKLLVASAAREFLYCVQVVEPRYFLIGFNLDTREWEVVRQEEPMDLDGPLELRPDLFLS